MHKRRVALVATVVVALVVPFTAYAAALSNGKGTTCGSDSVGSYHFVNTQTGGATAGTLSVTFSIGGDIVTVVDSNPKVQKNNMQWTIEAPDGATLVDADSGSVPGKIVLSDFSCTTVKKK